MAKLADKRKDPESFLASVIKNAPISEHSIPSFI